MISRTIPFLCSSREASQNLGWALAGGMGGNDGLYSIYSYNETTAIKPVADVCLSRNPLQIIGAWVQPVFVFVVDDPKIERVWNEGDRNKAMDQNRFDGAVLRQLNFGVPPSIGAVNANPRTSVPSFGSAHIPADALDASMATDLVKVFVACHRAPFLSWKNWDVIGFLSYAKSRLNGCLNIELLDLPGSREKSDEIAVVRVDTKKSLLERAGASVPSVWDFPGHAANTVKIRKFIKSFVARNGKPTLNLIRHMFLLFFPKDQDRYMPCRQSRQPENMMRDFKEMATCRSL